MVRLDRSNKIRVNFTETSMTMRSNHVRLNHKARAHSP